MVDQQPQRYVISREKIEKHRGYGMTMYDILVAGVQLVQGEYRYTRICSTARDAQFGCFWGLNWGFNGKWWELKPFWGI